jgi:aryl-alcohol dehydrogenase-like predicted oxidoreductase
MNMETTRLGAGLIVSRMGLGCMGMSHAYGTPGDAESIATIHRALDRGLTLLDTAEVYGPHTNEELVGRAIQGRRSEVVLATKFGISFVAGVQTADGTPANAKRAVEGSLKRLGVDVIDLYYLHRKDPNVPIEESIGGMKTLVEAGKVRFLGLSEVGAETLRRAHKVHPVTALQSEYSLWERGLEDTVLPVARELGIGIVPFSPLGRGLLTGALPPIDNLPARDLRRLFPRFWDEHLAANRRIVEGVKGVAARLGATPGQVALAWVLGQGNDIVPIPGTKHRKYLDENLDALQVQLSPRDLEQLNTLAALSSGDRYPPGQAHLVER